MRWASVNAKGGGCGGGDGERGGEGIESSAGTKLTERLRILM
jgi:hypothetical protein